LQERRWNELSNNLGNLSLACSGTVEWLEHQPDDSFDYFGLSNILELLPSDYANAVHKQILRCARKNALVCVRGIFPRHTPVFSTEVHHNRKLLVDAALNAEAEKMDRSLFCNFYQIFRCHSAS
jgi:S-adenosylmethionine:diacylglycerol 3-amino-3-carboxypropyl transferase